MKTFFQALSLLLFTSLFFLATYTIPDWLPADLYLRLDPLLGLGAVLARKEMILRALWSLILLGATLFVGRFFCAYACPMGAAIDFLDRPFFRKRARRDLPQGKFLRQVKFFLLFLFLSAALGGLSVGFFLDPISLLTRVYALVFYPLAITLINLLLDLFRPVLQALGWIGLARWHTPQPVFYLVLATFLIFSAIIALSRYGSRFWCRYLCPLGAFLALFSPLGLFKRRVNEDCNECLKCRKNCPMAAIEEDPRRTRLPECIQCRTCADVCPQKAVTFSPVRKTEPGSGGELLPVEISRRGFLYSFTGGLTLSFLAERTPFAPLRGKRQLVRPPGALPEDEFLQACIRCGECLKSCITNTLQPCLWEGGLSGLWTPKLETRYAACEQSCHVCGKVCPTQAIRSVSLEEKNHAKIGTAILRKEMCLVWAEDKVCLICDEICPYNAIVFRTIDGFRRPVVIPSRCNGCGWCEVKCPVKGDSAIVVVPHGEIRLQEGSYVAEAKKLQLEFKPDPGDDQFILQKSGLKAEEGKKEDPPAKTPAKEQKPKGFR
jgi:polyferredoxin